MIKMTKNLKGVWLSGLMQEYWLHDMHLSQLHNEFIVLEKGLTNIVMHWFYLMKIQYFALTKPR